MSVISFDSGHWYDIYRRALSDFLKIPNTRAYIKSIRNENDELGVLISCLQVLSPASAGFVLAKKYNAKALLFQGLFISPPPSPA